MRASVPTRVNVAGRRYRFVIHSSDPQGGAVRFSARIDGHSRSYVVRSDDVVTIGGYAWRVSRLDTGTPARLRLDRLPEPEGE